MTADAAPIQWVEVIKPGLLTTVQDQGRPGLSGIALSRGAMDRHVMALANSLVGNAPEDAGIEATGPGPTLRFGCDVWIASVGAQHALTRSSHDDSHGIALPTQRPVFVRAGSTLHWGPPTTGWRSWIAVAGGLALARVLSSRSAHLASGIGPSRIAAGDRLPLAADASRLAIERGARVLERIADRASRPWPSWRLPDQLPHGWPQIELPVLAGRHFGQLSAPARRSLLEQTWTVSAQSNRQGLRLDGNALDTAALPQLASEPVSFGTVQLPPSGHPVILLAEHQTTGGYPRVLEVASAAETQLAQAAPACRIRFRLIDLNEADRLAQQHARRFALTMAGVSTTCDYPMSKGPANA
jgi:antagonist of KipI